MRIRALFLVSIALAAACPRAGPEARVPAAAPQQERGVPGIETALVVEATISEVVEAPCAITGSPQAAAVDEARTRLAEAVARRRLAAQQLHRLEELSHDAVAPRRELEAARAEEAAAEATAERSRRALAAFGDQAQRAPLGPDETWGLAELLQRDVGRVAAGAEVRFRADAAPGRTFPGRVDAPAAYVDPVSGLAPVRVRLDDPERLLRPGMTGAASIGAGREHAGILAPASAIVYDGSQPVLFVEASEGRFQAHLVRVGATRDGHVEVAGDVAPGARVATTGAASLLSTMRLPAGGAEDAD